MKPCATPLSLMLLLGSACGLALGLGSERYIVTLLYQVKATDPPMLILPALVLTAVAAVAAVPAVIRAWYVDPASMLRVE